MTPRQNDPPTENSVHLPEFAAATSHRPSRSDRSPRTAVPFALGLAALTFAIGANLATPGGELSATTGLALADSDADGISDVHEEVLGLSLDSDDTDRDGWSDLEEVTRGSDPKDHAVAPSWADVDIDVSGYMDDGVMHVVTSVYQKGGLGSGHSFQFGVFHRKQAYLLPPALFLPYATIRELPGRSLTDTVHVMDVRLPQGLIEAMGEMTFFAVARPHNSEQGMEGSAFKVVSTAGIPYQIAPPANLPSSASQGTVVRGRGFFRPLTPLSNLPSGAAKGQVCVQSSRVAGAGGVGVHLEVTAATCQSGDGVCPSSCAGTVGSTFDVLDPVVLVGG